MQKIITKNGSEYAVRWCGQSDVDFALRFEVTGSTMAEVLATFTNPEETAILTHVFDEKEAVFRGYTTFKGVDMKPGGTIVVALMEG